MVMRAPSGSAEAPASARPTVVLVHGAFADSSSWNGVVKLLLAQGYPVIAVAVPLRGLKSDSDYVAAVLGSVKGPVVLVGHSYGGLVITNAANGRSNVKALVFVAGFAPAQGESGAGLTALFPGSTLGETIAEPIVLPGGGNDLYIERDKFPEQVAADVPASEALVMAATQRPATGTALNEASAAAAWKTIASWFIFGELDKNIPAAAHAFMAERARARDTFMVKGASHVVMISHPDAVAKMIVDAATSVARGGAMINSHQLATKYEPIPTTLREKLLGEGYELPVFGDCDPQRLRGFRVAFLISHGPEVPEFHVPLTYLRDRGASVEVVTEDWLFDSNDPGASGKVALAQFLAVDVCVKADKKLSDAKVDDYDAVVVLGGAWNPILLRSNDAALRFLIEAHARRILIAALCHGPQVLISTKAFPKGTHATGVDDIQRDLENAGFFVEDKPVVYDEGQRLITGRNPQPDALKAFCDEIGRYACHLIQERT